MRHVIAICALLAAGAALAQEAGSLWSDATGSLIKDLKARAVGDVLTVIITETASASSKADLTTSKKDTVSASAGAGPILSAILPELSGSTSSESSGSGSTTRSGSLTARMTVTVKQVLPNGNLVIEGKRDVLVNKEFQKLVLTGIVRPVDVSPGNTIPSYLIADAEIRYEGKGPVGRQQREGLIVRLFNSIFGGLF